MSAKSEEKKEGARAVQTLQDIRKLRKDPVFQRYFEARVVKEVQRLREIILTDRELDKDSLWNARLKFFAAFDTSKIMLQDEAACRAMLDAMPIDPDEEETAIPEE